ncbi:MAG: MCE family protein [Sphingobacteriales bacterium]|nr:MAG: MCE family protein [Sphingobacteriales bacterium]
MNKRAVIQSVVTVLLIVAVIVAWRNKRYFTGEHDYYTYYHDIQGLQQSSSVMINGVRVGKIRDIDLNGGGRVKVTISLKKKIELTEGTAAYLATFGITGEKIIELRPGVGPNILPDEAVLPSGYDSSVMSATVRVTPMLELTKSILNASDSTLQSFTGLFRSGILTSTTTRIISVEKNSKGFASAMASMNESTNGICRKLRGADSSTRSMAMGNAERTKSIADAKKQSADLAKTNVAENFKKLKTSFATLKTSLSKVNENKLINDSSAYYGMARGVDTFRQGIDQMYKNPKGFSMFGKKEKK